MPHKDTKAHLEFIAVAPSFPLTNSLERTKALEFGRSRPIGRGSVLGFCTWQ